MPVIADLTWWWEEITQKGKNRNKGHIRDMAVGGGDGVQYNVMGVAGEYAVALDRCYELSQIRDDQPRGDGGIDLVAIDGSTIQVKTNKGFGFDNNLSREPQAKADYVIGCRFEVQRIKIAAWATRGQWNAAINEHHTGGFCVNYGDINIYPDTLLSR